MLSKENNELLTRTGPGTPMGNLMRLYWVPAFLSEELAEPDGTPIRVRILGEKLVAFRDTQGRIGLMDESCPHRGAPLSYGRNEESGLRCIYHGWKLDVDGNLLDTPGERGDTSFKEKLKHTVYPTREAGGVVWAYLGPKDQMPPFPEFEWLKLPLSHVHVQKVLLECNYLQSVEGGIDSAHISFLHRTEINYGHVAIATTDTAPEFEVQGTPYGFRYAALRNKGDTHRYVRITPFIMPFYTIVPFADEQSQAQHAWVPADDHHNWAYTFSFKRYGEMTPADWTHPMDMGENYRKLRNVDNMHMQDRAAMRAGTSFSGIRHIMDQDAAVQEGMGYVVDRTKEHLRKSDAAIVNLRRMLLRKLQEPVGAERLNKEAYAQYDLIRCEIAVIPIEKSWREIGYSDLL